MTKIIVSIDNHVTIASLEIIAKANELIEREGVHFDESPFGSFQQLHPGEYWSDEIIKDSPINENFDILNYIKRSWEKWDNWTPNVKVTTAKERLEEGKINASFFGFGKIKECAPKCELIPKRKLPLK